MHAVICLRQFLLFLYNSNKAGVANNLQKQNVGIYQMNEHFHAMDSPFLEEQVAKFEVWLLVLTFLISTNSMPRSKIVTLL